MTLLDTGAFRGVGTTGPAGDPVNAILKIVYEGAVRDMLNSTTVANRLLDRDLPNTRVSGQYVTSSIRTGRNVGIAYVPERGKLPKAGKQSTTTVSYRTRSLYGRGQLTGNLITAAAQSQGAFIDSLDFEVNGLGLDMHNFQQRVIYGDGAGRLARVKTAASGANLTIELDNPGGIASTALGTQYVVNGMRVAFWDPGTTAESAVTFYGTPVLENDGTAVTFEITAVDYNAGTITLSNGAGLAVEAGAYVYLAIEEGIATAAINYGNISRGHEMFGLAAICDDDDPDLYDNTNVPAPFQGLGNVLVADVDAWKAFVLHNSGTAVPFNEVMLQKAIDGVRQLSNGRPKYMLTTYGIRRQFAAGMISQKRYPAVLDFKGGFRAVSYDDIPMIVDKDCTRGRIYGIDPTSMAIIKENDWGFLDKDGRVLQKVPDYNAYEFNIGVDQQLVCIQRNTNFQIRDIQDQ